MADYHVGCGYNAIYAGTLIKNSQLWRNKSECTEEAVAAVANYMLLKDSHFEVTINGLAYKLELVRIDEDA